MDISAIRPCIVAVHMHDDDQWSTMHFLSLLCCFRQSMHDYIASSQSPDAQMLCKIGCVNQLLTCSLENVSTL